MNQQQLFLQDANIGFQSKVMDAFVTVAAEIDFASFRAAVAYASHKGCVEFERNISATAECWRYASKQWLISIDYGQTAPEALEFLANISKSEVRIPDAGKLLGNKLKPTRAFHPKVFVLTDSNKRPCTNAAIIHGSANLTFGALHFNAEQLVAARLWGKHSHGDKDVHTAIEQFDEWWELAWKAATPLTSGLLGNYQQLYSSAPRLQDAEQLSEALSVGGEVALDEAVRWASARCFWIETKDLYKNRGKNHPGNQLDCRRGTRVFFGFASATVPQDTVFGEVIIGYENMQPQARSMRFGNNSMDKLNLPVPVEFGPDSYDNTVLHFERIGPRRFVLKRGDSSRGRVWRKRSEREGLAYELAGGRRYGFYS